MELDDLPEMTGSNVCQNCKSDDWSAARVDVEGNVIMCTECHGIPDDWDPLMEMQ